MIDIILISAFWFFCLSIGNNKTQGNGSEKDNQHFRPFR